MPTPEKILFVDNDPIVLQGYERLLHAEFSVETAVGGKAGLAAITANPSYAAIVSDQRMGDIDGITLLSQAKKVAPNAIRILLAGKLALETAISAINDGNIFRILIKPCPKEKLTAALTAALQQFRLLTVEKDVVEKTFMEIIRMLTEVLGLVNPASFSRAIRLRRYLKLMATAAGIKEPWKVEIAAMMSQLGYVTLDPELVTALHKGQELTRQQQVRYDRHPEVAQRLLANIPRMESIAWMIGHQNKTAPADSDMANREKAERRKGAELLRQAIDFDDFVRKGASRVEAGHRMGRKYKTMDQNVLLALVKMEPEAGEVEVVTYPVEQLSTGMVVEEDVYSERGLLVASKGQEINLALRLKLENFNHKEPFADGISVSMPKASAS